jgi:hypothetical protein
MPPLPSRPEEIFCVTYAEESDASLAAIRARIRKPGELLAVTCRELLERPDIQARISEIRERDAPEPVTVTHRSMIEDLEDVYNRAIALSDLKAAISAKGLQAEIAGLKVHRVEVTRKRAPDEYSDEQLEEIMNRKYPRIEGTVIKSEVITEDDDSRQGILPKLPDS